MIFRKKRQKKSCRNILNIYSESLLPCIRKLSIYKNIPFIPLSNRIFYLSYRIFSLIANVCIIYLRIAIITYASDL